MKSLLWRVWRGEHPKATLHELRTIYDINDLFDFLEELEFEHALAETTREEPR